MSTARLSARLPPADCRTWATVEETMADTDRRSFERMLADLRAQHAAFERALREELARRPPDGAAVRRLKRAKLTVTDRMTLIGRMGASGAA